MMKKIAPLNLFVAGTFALFLSSVTPDLAKAQNVYDPRTVATEYPAATAYDYTADIPKTLASVTLTMGYSSVVTPGRNNSNNRRFFSWRRDGEGVLVRRSYDVLPGRKSISHTLSNNGYTVTSKITVDPRLMTKGTYYFYFMYITKGGDKREAIYRLRIV